MHRTQRHRTKHRRRRKEFLSSVKGVCHLSRRAKRRLYCKLQLWVWRKRRESCRFVFGRGRRARSLECSQVKTPDGFTDVPGRPTHLPQASESLSNAGLTQIAMATAPPRWVENFRVVADPSELSASARPLTSDSHACGSIGKDRAMVVAHMSACTSLQEDHTTLPRVQRRGTDSDESINAGRTAKSSNVNDVSVEALVKDIHEFLSDFYRAYGSFIPLQRSDVLKHLRRKLNCDLNGRKNLIFTEVVKYLTPAALKLTPSFRVVFKKHILTLDDLSTLADQNWLNDQVMNMYGELIMEAARNKVHFLNSFFHRQLMTKGYDGVKRWTKQIDLFSKSLLLVPIHLEVHWCLVTADIVKKKICLYDSQGNALHKVARNILKYLIAEAKAKQRPAFEGGWTVSFSENIPQQTNENDCGVFVLEYSRCLALAQPLNFSQDDIPKIRKRIYKELCNCKLHEHG